MKIVINNLSKFYNDANNKLRVIDNFSYTFNSGSKSAIFGRSGIGKSTLLNLIAGLDEINIGEIYFDEILFSALSSEQQALFRVKNLGFVFQFHHLLPEFTAQENVAMPLIIAGIEHKKALLLANNMLEKVGLKSRVEHRPGELSGGEQQRVSLARALINNPKVLLADEPTGNLDYLSAKLVKDLLFELTTELKTTLIIVTHSNELVNEMEQKFEMTEFGGLVKC